MPHRRESPNYSQPHRGAEVTRRGILEVAIASVLASNAQAQQVGALAGKPLHYLIGADNPGPGSDSVVTEVGYDNGPVKRGISIAYCNLFDEKNTGEYGPYLKRSDTARKYNEGQIDPRGIGWLKNLSYQFKKRAHQDFKYIEIDNPDAYAIEDVIRAIEMAAAHELKVIAKNPGLMGHGAVPYLRHPNVYGAIVERDAGTPVLMNSWRSLVGKPDMPVWFVAFGGGKPWATRVATAIRQNAYREMRVSYSQRGEYEDSVPVQ